VAVLKQSLHTQHCNTESPPHLLNQELINQYLEEIPQWDFSPGESSISRRYTFKNYYKVLAFVNAAAWIAQQENHHPEISFGYNKCTILYTTHSANGLTLFDFICAAKTDQLLINEE
jgi:4a-hydroxytetrahydrobiopterin dehydratase